MDILFKTEGSVFSYRVAGICIENGSVLLQKPDNDPGFAFPGGHAALGETNEQTLIREFREEIGADISVGALRWVGELFFPWGERTCHQICLFYDVTIEDSHTPREGSFRGCEQLEGQHFGLGFYWVPLSDTAQIELYPTNVKEWLTDSEKSVRHFIYREE